MADDPKPSADRKPLNLNRDVKVTRMTVDKSEVKDMHVDLLEAIETVLGKVDDSIQKQTDTLEEALEDLQDKVEDTAEDSKQRGKKQRKVQQNTLEDVVGELQNLNTILRNQLMGGGGGEGGGGLSTGVGLAELEAQRQFQKAIDGSREELTNFGEMIKFIRKESKKAWKEQLNVPLRELRLSLVRTVQNMSNFSNMLDQLKDRYRESTELSTLGLATFMDVTVGETVKLFEFGQGELRDSIHETGKMLQTQLSKDLVSPLIAFGTDLRGTSKVLAEMRREAENAGLDLYANLGFREQNEILSELLLLQKRGTVQEDIATATNFRRVNQQVEFLQLIASNTGKSLETLLASAREDTRTLETLQAMGIVTDQEAENTQTMLAALGPNHRELLMALARSGFDRAAFMANNPELGKALAATGNLGIIERMGALVKSDQTHEERLRSVVGAFEEFSANSTRTGEQMGGFVQNLLEGATQTVMGITADTNEVAKTLKNPPEKGIIETAVNKIDDYLTNVFPVANLKFLGSLAANTVALAVNTASITGLSAIMGGGGIMKLLGTVTGLGKGGFIRKAIGGIGSLMGLGGAASAAVRPIARGAGLERLNRIRQAGGGGLLGFPGGAGGGAGAAARSTAGAGGALARGGGRLLSRAVPGLGTLLSGGAAIGSLMKGDVLGGLGHGAASIASLFPGIGTGIAVGLEGALLARELGKKPAEAADQPLGAQTKMYATDAGTTSSPLEAMVHQTRRTNRILSEMHEIGIRTLKIQRDIRDRITVSGGGGGMAVTGTTIRDTNAVPFAALPNES